MGSGSTGGAGATGGSGATGSTGSGSGASFPGPGGAVTYQ
jgi:hypothetical protein